MNEILKCIKERRSHRQYLDQPIQDFDLDMILEAGLYAPNAGGRQSPVFVVIQDKELIETLGIENRKAMPSRLGSHVSNEQPSIIDNPDIKSGFYGASTLIIFFAPNHYTYMESDCAMSAQNMMLTAHSLGLGSCYIGRAKETFESKVGQTILSRLNNLDNYLPIGHLIVGYPSGITPHAKERKSQRIIKL